MDTHALLWWLTDDPQLSPRARKLIRARSNTILVSAASAWEISTKYRLGKLPYCGELALQFEETLASELFDPLPISVAHASRAGLLPGPHRDPFDRMLIAQSQAENLPILSIDPAFDAYKVRRYWN
ncbi:MAG TPA: type II toxin-antitoxin system VapC family toxin [Candidatus Acidoferrum sp.]|nr:type II toxin-antitoxin system VapC family toxin [Candidatus Acidoferrum sp.]